MQVSNHFSNHFGPILLILGFPLPAPLYSQFQRNWCYQLPNILGNLLCSQLVLGFSHCHLRLSFLGSGGLIAARGPAFYLPKFSCYCFLSYSSPSLWVRVLKKQDEQDTFVKYAVLPWNTVLNWIGSFQKAYLKSMVYRVWCRKFTQGNLLFELKGENIN